jgi:hypothetical protein
MGWWEIDSVETGGIKWGVPSERSISADQLKEVLRKVGCGEVELAKIKGGDYKLANAIPGCDASEKLYCGDDVADVMQSAIDRINELFIKAWGRGATHDELKACFNFVSNKYK